MSAACATITFSRFLRKNRRPQRQVRASLPLWLKVDGAPLHVDALPSPSGRGWPAVGAFTSRSGTGEGSFARVGEPQRPPEAGRSPAIRRGAMPANRTASLCASRGCPARTQGCRPRADTCCRDVGAANIREAHTWRVGADAPVRLFCRRGKKPHFWPIFHNVKPPDTVNPLIPLHQD